jgi:aryl-phospho-beta-D-glucosidase BglC (GH1 family)
MRIIIWLALFCCAWLGWWGTATGSGATLQFVGVNLAGAEFGQATLPGVHGQHYIYPNQAEVDYFRHKGMNCVRLCFRWERLQSSIGAVFDPAEFNRLTRFTPHFSAIIRISRNGISRSLHFHILQR